MHHIRYPHRYPSHPILPDVPVILVDGRGIPTPRRALVPIHLPGRDRLVVLRVIHPVGQGRVRRALGRAVPADLEVRQGRGSVVRIIADPDAPELVVRVRDVAAVPGERGAVLDSREKLQIGSRCVGVAHVVDDRDALWLGEREINGEVLTNPLSLSTAAAVVKVTVARGDAVVVRRTAGKTGDRDVVEELRALGDFDQRTRRCPIVPARSSSIPLSRIFI